ncbi:MAG: DUF1365 domain-containing protein [Candidatus Nanopelagicales bacterium]
MVTTLSPPSLPALAIGAVSHTRRTPFHKTFRHRHYQWLVDVDSVPEYGWPLRLLARFDRRDHLDGGRLGGGFRGDVERFLAHRGIVLQRTDQVLMLANARIFGHTVDQLSVFWCLRADRSLRCVVLEVHNTYRERHAYLVEVDDTGCASIDKEFYVSPFNDVSGTYDVRLRLTPDAVAVVIGLNRDGQRVLTATSQGRLVPATRRALVGTSCRHLVMTQRVSALIRLHGIGLWLRGLPVLPRPPHSREAVR